MAVNFQYILLAGAGACQREGGDRKNMSNSRRSSSSSSRSSRSSGRSS